MKEFVNKFGEGMRDAIEKTSYSEVETGFGICKAGDAYSRTDMTVGKKHEVEIPMCEVGGNVGAFHTHPMDIEKPSKLSAGDKWNSIRIGRNFECVGTPGFGRGKIKCYSYKKENKTYEKLQKRIRELQKKEGKEYALEEKRAEGKLKRDEKRKYRRLKKENQNEFEDISEKIKEKKGSFVEVERGTLTSKGIKRKV